jgi:hypothetical protein
MNRRRHLVPCNQNRNLENNQQQCLDVELPSRCGFDQNSSLSGLIALRSHKQLQRLKRAATLQETNVSIHPAAE